VSESRKLYGLLAEFKDPAALFHAAVKMRDAGYKRFDCHSPFPIHGMDAAMGLKRSKVGYVAGIMAAVGFILGLGLQWYTSAVDYPLVISGKPFFSYQAFVPVTFGATVLFGAIGALGGMLVTNRLPQWYHELFNSERFSQKVNNDGFFVSVTAKDTMFAEQQTREFLQSIGGYDVEAIYGE
jgi:hypothetical protein